MSSKLSVKEFSFISYFLFSHNSCDRCTITDDDVDEDKVGLKVEDREEKKEEDNDDLEVSGEDHRWELPVLHYQKILVIYPYPFFVVIILLLSQIIFMNDCICILTGPTG